MSVILTSVNCSRSMGVSGTAQSLSMASKLTSLPVSEKRKRLIPIPMFEKLVSFPASEKMETMEVHGRLLLIECEIHTCEVFCYKGNSGANP